MEAKLPLVENHWFTLTFLVTLKQFPDCFIHTHTHIFFSKYQYQHDLYSSILCMKSQSNHIVFNQNNLISGSKCAGQQYSKNYKLSSNLGFLLCPSSALLGAWGLKPAGKKEQDHLLLTLLTLIKTDQQLILTFSGLRHGKRG